MHFRLGHMNTRCLKNNMGQPWCGTPLHHHGHIHCIGRLAQMVRALDHRMVQEVISSSLIEYFVMFYVGRYTVSGSGADCKSAVLDSGGSTPSLPTKCFMEYGAFHETSILSRVRS